MLLLASAVVNFYVFVDSGDYMALLLLAIARFGSFKALTSRL